MKKYTFIAEYRSGTYISQFSTTNVSAALLLWVDNLDNVIFSDHKRQKIKEEVIDTDFSLIPIKGVQNVWCQSYLSGKYFLLLNVIETV